MWYLYILLCDNHEFYTGITHDLDKRLTQHKEKRSLFTKRYKNLKLVYTETYQAKNKAERRERQIKGWTRAKKNALISNDKVKLQHLSRSIARGEESG